MKRAVIVANGNLSDMSQAMNFITNKDYIVCADGGVEHLLKFGIIPHAVIGDFDSIQTNLQKKLSNHQVKWIRYPEKKDKTDFELVADHILKKKFNQMIVFGLLGDRLDHFLANIFLLVKIYLHNNSMKIKIIEGKQEMYFVKKILKLKGNIGDEISLIPLNNTINDIKLYGLEYQLNNEPLFFGSTKAISNVMIKKTAKIVIKKGTILVFHRLKI